MLNSFLFLIQLLLKYFHFKNFVYMLVFSKSVNFCKTFFLKYSVNKIKKLISRINLLRRDT
jgi:hypothetical protein